MTLITLRIILALTIFAVLVIGLWAVMQDVRDIADAGTCPRCKRNPLDPGQAECDACWAERQI